MATRIDRPPPGGMTLVLVTHNRVVSAVVPVELVTRLIESKEERVNFTNSFVLEFLEGALKHQTPVSTGSITTFPSPPSDEGEN